MSNQHVTPVFIGSNGAMEALTRIPLVSNAEGVAYDEAYLEDLLFRNPAMLPIREIDAAYANPVPVCTQLSTRVGPLDVLYVTEEGRLVVVEAKLWRNPEQRRKVVAQIIDYAAELSKWSYDDLEREVAKRTKATGNVLFSLVSEKHPNILEAEFVDSVSRSLRDGRFLLLICGDGIREELSGIAEFLDRNTTLDLTFGLLELAIFGTASGGRLVLPRVLAKTVTIRRQVLRIEGGSATVVDDHDAAEIAARGTVGSREPTGQQLKYVQFWSELAETMHFDDASQPPITVARAPNTNLRMPSPRAWITLYFAPSSGGMGIFLTFNRGEPGDTFYRRLEQERGAIGKELPAGTVWKSDGEKHVIELRREMSDFIDPAQRAEAIEWYTENANEFVNAFRPRIGRYVEEL
ncbi:hypothetical protein [Aminobacter aminovorans]|uniref:hypothetical protein n=1 Tax=Aminobacter aminovorans TaxID=83263 RepID=UPI0028665DEB|nr:hypothetical protein [Aminobacter aminovorans]MDR7225220.1 hypothetical protein [Aminobacter aminovorans]